MKKLEKKWLKFLIIETAFSILLTSIVILFFEIFSLWRSGENKIILIIEMYIFCFIYSIFDSLEVLLKMKTFFSNLSDEAFKK